MLRRRYRLRRNPTKALSIDELRLYARRNIPNFAFEYIDGGADDEVSLRRNREIFEKLPFQSRTLVGVAQRDLSTSLFGRRTSLPIAIAPTGFNGITHRHGDLALAKAAAKADIPFIQSTVSTMIFRDVAQGSGVRHWMQLYIFKNRSVTERLLQNALEAGSEALVVTTDAFVLGNREWDKRNFARPFVLNWRNKLDVLRHPDWYYQVMLRDGAPHFANLVDALPGGGGALAARQFARAEMDASINWGDMQWLRNLWPRKLVIKGLIDPADVRRAADIGADGIVLSNHGGRQLDGVISPMAVLPEVAAEFGGRLAIMIDSGFRRGTDIVKAIALGADLVLLGRAPLYGLAAAGEDGVSRALAILREEIDRTLALLGTPTLSDCAGTVIDSMRR